MAEQNKLISIVIPVFNEEASVKPLCSGLCEMAERVGLPSEFIFVDDGSSDGTWEALDKVAQGDSRVRAIRLARNFGQTAAMSCGIESAGGEVIVTMDGDLQNDPADIPAMLKLVDEGYGVVCGWRYRRKDHLWTRRLPSLVANRLIGWLTGVRLHDYGCSLKAYRAEIIKRTPLYAEFHRFITALVTLTGAQVTELKVNHRPRRFGRTKYNLWRTWKVAFDMVTVALLIKFAVKPLRFFGSLALACFAVAVVCALRSWHWYIGPYHVIPQALPGAAVLGVWLACHLAVVGFLAELSLASAHARPQTMVVARELGERVQ